MVTEGGNEDMEVDVSRQQNDQFMEHRSEPHFEHIPNQQPLHVEKTFAITKQASNLLPIGTKPIQLKLVEPIQLRPIYTFPEISSGYA